MTHTLVCFDCETTGLVGPRLRSIARQPHVTEFAAVRFEMDEDGDGEEVEHFAVLVNPTVTIPPQLVRKIGIAQADVDRQPVFKHFAPGIRAILAGAEARCGHNLTFDERMLDIEFARIGEPWRAEGQLRLCSVEQAEPLYGKRITLSDLHRSLLGSEHTGAHRALDDVRATVKCIRALRAAGDL